MIVARRDMTLNSIPVVAGQVLDSIWPTLRELAQRNLLRQRWVEDVRTDGFQTVREVTAASPNTTNAPSPVNWSPGLEQPLRIPLPTKKRGRPKGSKNKPKLAAQA